MADSYIDLIPLFADQDEETIRARWDSWANESLGPEDENRVDTREGSVFYVLTQPGVMEAAAIYDRMGSEVIAASTPLYAFGSYLDDHAEAIGLERTAATAAEGTVRFIGTDGTVIPAGTQVETESTDPSVDPVTFQTTETVTISGGIAEAAVIATEVGAQGNVAAASVTVLSVPQAGLSVTNDDPMVGGSDPEDDEHLRDKILSSYGDLAPANVLYYQRLGLEQDGVGRVAVIPLYKGPGTALIVLMTEAGGPVGQTTVDEFQDVVDPATFTTTLSADVAVGATTINVVSTDGSYPAPGVLEIGSDVVSYTGVTGTSFTGCSGVASSHLTGGSVIQRQGGQGQGGVGAYIRVTTSTSLTITVSATVFFEPGYSLDGSGSTVALRDLIETEVAAYVESRPPGDTITYVKVLSAIGSVTGVRNLASVALNGDVLDISLSSDPPESPILETPLTLTEG